jgi:hypothetical protein
VPLTACASTINILSEDGTYTDSVNIYNGDKTRHEDSGF